MYIQTTLLSIAVIAFFAYKPPRRNGKAVSVHLLERSIQSLLFHMSGLNMPLHELLLRAVVSTAFAGIAWAFPSRSRRGKTKPVRFVFMRLLRKMLGKLLPFIVNRFASLLFGSRNGWYG
jgi:hypothetical protein